MILAGTLFVTVGIYRGRACYINACTRPHWLKFSEMPGCEACKAAKYWGETTAQFSCSLCKNYEVMSEVIVVECESR